MQRLIYSLAIALSALCVSLPVYAQANVLGLPAVPQKAPVANPDGTAANPGARPAASAATPQQIDEQAKSVLSGGVTLSSNYDGRTVTVVVTTNNLYQGQEQRKAAFKAARLVQRDVRVSCAKQCKAAASMPAPQILPSGKLEFAMVVNDYPRELSGEDMMALLMGKPLAVIPLAAVKAATAPASGAPAPAPNPTSGASAAPATSATPTTSATR